MTKGKKVSALLLSVAMTASFCMLAACGSNDEEPEAAVEVEGQSTVLQTNKSPEELNADEVIYAYLYRQSQFSSYKITTTGSTYASKGIINYTQKIDNVAVKHADEYFAQAVSSSSFVNMSHQSFSKTVDGVSKVAYRNDLSGDISTASRADYKTVYGIAPDDVALGGFIINDNTVQSFSVDLSDKSNLKYVVTLKADSDEGLGAMRTQMKQFGGLDNLPVFSSVKLTLTLKNDWTPVSLTTESAYSISISVLGEMDCTQKITATYSAVNGSVEIPDTQAFNQAVGSTPSQVSGITHETSPMLTAFSDVYNAFANYDYEQGMHFGIELSSEWLETKDIMFGMTMLSGPLTAEVYVKYNPDEVAYGNLLNAVNFRMDVDLGNAAMVFAMMAMGQVVPPVYAYLKDVSIYYVGDGNLYIALTGYDEFGDVFAEETVFEFVQIGLGDAVDALLPLIGTIGAVSSEDFDLDDFVDTLNGLFDVTVQDGETVFGLKNDYVQMLSLVYNGIVDGLVESAVSSMPDMAEMIEPILGGLLKVDLEYAKLHVVNGENGLSEIYFDIGCSQTEESEDETAEAEEPQVYVFAKLGLTVKGTFTDELEGDAAVTEAHRADEAVASVLRAQIDWAGENMWLDENDSYLAYLGYLAETYRGMTPEQQGLVANYYMIETYSDLYTSLKKNADLILSYFDGAEFRSDLTASDWEKVNKAYDNECTAYDMFRLTEHTVNAVKENVAAIRYISQAKIDAYLAARNAYGNANG